MRFGAFVRPLSLALFVLFAACSSAASAPIGEQARSQTQRDAAALGLSETAVIDVASGSTLAVSLKGSAAVTLAEQTVTRALVVVEQVEIETASGTRIALLDRPFEVDMIQMDNDLVRLVEGVRLQAGRYTRIRCRLSGVFVQTIDARGVVRAYSTGHIQSLSTQQATEVSTLVTDGLDADGFFTIGLPPTGILLAETSSIALRFGLAESLSVRSDGAWVLRPALHALDAQFFSTLDVRFSASTRVSSSFSFQGFQVQLLDAHLRPVCVEPLAVFDGGVLGADFRFLDTFEGPFVAVLLPPKGLVLSSSVSMAVRIEASVHAEAHISIQSVSTTTQTDGTVLVAVEPQPEATVIEHATTGEVIHEEKTTVGELEEIAASLPRAERPGPLEGERPRPTGEPARPEERGTPPAREEAPPAEEGIRPAEEGAPPADATPPAEQGTPDGEGPQQPGAEPATPPEMAPPPERPPPAEQPTTPPEQPAPLPEGGSVAARATGGSAISDEPPATKVHRGRSRGGR